MISHYLFVAVFACIFNARCAFSARPSLETILGSATDFFEQLKLNYESQPASPELLELIDNQLVDYVNKVKNSTNTSRGKRHLDLGKEIGILNGFEKVFSLDLPNATDVTFFEHRHGSDLLWYTAVLDPSGVTLMQYQGHTFSRVGDVYKLQNGTRIISHSCESATLLVVQTLTGEAPVIRLSSENSRHTLGRVQPLGIPSASHATLWRAMKQIFLAVGSPKNFTVYTWLGEHFDRIQSENLDAGRLIPFQIGGSMHLIATNERRTSILKFLLSTRKFVVVQKLVGAMDATALRLESGHFGEHFVALAGRRSTVIYKQSRHRFVPFQEIIGAEEIRSMTNDAAVLLILIRKEEIKIYQYDGWKFAETSVRAVGVVDAVPLSFKGAQILAMKSKDRHFEDRFRNDLYSLTNETTALSGRISGDSSERFDDLGDRTSKFSVTYRFGKSESFWSFQRIKWRGRKTWASLREETKIWCRSSLQKTLRVAAAVPEVDGSVTIERGYIKNLRAREVNGESAEKFVKLNDRWKTIADETERQQRAVKNYVSRVNPSFENLRAGNVSVNCTTSCRATSTETAMGTEFLKRLRRIDNPEKNLEFRYIRVSSVPKNLRCPIPSVKFRDATVTGLVNGIHFSEFVEDLLKVTGDQELTGSHTFTELQVRNARITLDVASNFTRQDIVAETVKIDELKINSGGLLLPLNGSFSVLSGSLTVPKAKINGLIDVQAAGIRGKGRDTLLPMIHVTEPLELSGIFTLRNVKIVESLETKDLTRSSGKTFKEIASNALPLNSKHIPVHLKFRNDKVSWKNMTLRSFPYKWVTKKNCGHVIITGNKTATMPNLTLGKLAYANLPTPRLPLDLCAMDAFTEGIWESNFVIDRGSAKSIKSINVFDKSELSEVFLDSAISLSEVPWSLKNLTGRITVKSANIGKIAGMDYQGLNKSIARWIKPGRLIGPVNVTNLKVNTIIAPAGFKVSLPLEVGNAKSIENIYVGKLNSFNYKHFLDNVVKVEDTVSLTNVTFTRGLVANEIFASETSFSLQEKIAEGYMGSKEIIGALDSKALNVPDVLHFPASNVPVNIITKGSVEFINEPSVVNVNHKNLERLYDEIWMADRATIISADFIELKTVSFKNDLRLLKSFDTPSLGPWDGIESRLLSRTRSQKINVSASFSSIEAPNVFGAAKSHLRSNISYLNDLEFNSLKMNDTQVIKNNWTFEELIVTDNVDLRGRINNLNLATDIARYDVEKNVITGKKIVGDLVALNIDGLKFGDFARNALRMNNENRTIVIKGWKSFKTVEMPYMSVDGTIMGSRIENSLLKSSTQILRGSKDFQGSLKTPEIVTNGTVNDIDLQYFVAYQLKKRANSQTIKTRVLLSNNLTIVGNVTIDGLYQGVELRNLRSSTNTGLESVVQKTSELLNFAEGIDVALGNRAFYWDKLELVERNSTPLISDPVKNELVQLDGLGRCRIDLSSLYCNDRKMVDFYSAFSNGSSLLQARIIKLAGVSLLAYVTSDPEGGIFILQFDRGENRFRQVTALLVPGIMAGSFTTTMDCLWISLRLHDDIMILRYELWARDFQEWILPGSGAFLMSSTPTDELLILRADGVWKLGGLAGPRHVFHATLNGQIDTFSFGPDYYVQLTDGNVTTLLKSRYIGN